MDSHKTTIPTLAVLVVLCLLGLLFGVKALTNDLPTDPLLTQPPICSDRLVAAGTKVFPEDVLVSVFNGGGRSGVASETLGKLVERGFAAGDTENADDADLRFVQVWADDPDNPAVQLVARQFGKRTKISTGHPVLGPGVVVVLGSDFERLGRKVPSVTAESEATICSPPLD